MAADVSSTRGAGVSIKPGVERSETPGTRPLKISEARGAAGSRIITIGVCSRTRCRPLRGLNVFFLFLILGFRCAPPQDTVDEILQSPRSGRQSNHHDWGM